MAGWWDNDEVVEKVEKLASEKAVLKGNDLVAAKE